MAVINPITYQEIADLYAQAQQQVADIADYYYAAAVAVLEENVFAPELDLLKPFYQAYLSAATAYSEAPGPVVGAVQSLQQHVLAEGTVADAGISDVNDWLSDNSILVYVEYATISAQAGFTIDADNLK